MAKARSDRSRLPVNDERSIVRTSMTRFALLSLLAFLVLGTGIELASRHVARHEALRDAGSRSRGLATGVAAPLVNTAVRRGDRAALSRLGLVMDNRIREGALAHVVIYSRDGRVLWSDDAALVGNRYPFAPELETAIRAGHVVTGLPGAEGRHAERIGGEDSLLEVYVPARDADGEPFVFEAYIPPDRIITDRNAILRELLPLGLGGLLVFQLTILPLAYSLARRVDRARRQRSELLHRSLVSWHEERRRLAQELHDGVVQDLSAASYALPSVIRLLPEDTAVDPARSTGERIGELLRQNLRAMRSLIFDLMPTDLNGVRLPTALEALAGRHRDAGLAVHLEVQPELEIDSEVAGLVYRVLREGLRNIERHAQASNAWVQVGVRNQMVEIVLADDGRGLRDSVPDREGHFGLRLLEGLARDTGGSLVLQNRAGGGAVLKVRVPTTLPD
jgi:signal transduction histidine kinase